MGLLPAAVDVSSRRRIYARSADTFRSMGVRRHLAVVLRLLFAQSIHASSTALDFLHVSAGP
jgi:hypothetical protein